MPLGAQTLDTDRVSADDPHCFDKASDITAQRVRLESEEDFVLRLWTMRVQYADFLGRKTEETAAGSALPPGWYFDINDPVLLTYDPYFMSHDGGANAVSSPILNATENRYYAKSALPLCRTECLSLKSCPPLGLFVKDEKAGDEWFHGCNGDFLAKRFIKAGEVIAMDVSELCIVEDPLVWRYFPSPSSTCVTEKGMKGAKIKGNGGNYMKYNSRTHCSFPSLLISAARQIVLQAYAIENGKESLVTTGYAQLLASLLLTYGDTDLLPTEIELKEAINKWTSCRQLTFGTALQRSQRAEAFVRRWCTTSTKSETVIAELRRSAILLLQCVPPMLLSSTRKDAAATGGCLAFVNIDEPVILPHYGFFRRVGLHTPDRLVQFLLGFLRKAVFINVPDLPMRFGLFPFLRLVPHRCRPNSVVMFLDCPASHCYGKSGLFDYNTLGSRIGEEANEKPPTPWGFSCSERIFLPSVAVLVACRDIKCGEYISHSLFHSVYMTQPQRSRFTTQLYGTSCRCQCCVYDVDVARAFRCPRCPPNCGVISPTGDGNRFTEWSCLQCGYFPGMDEINRCLDEERLLATVKADKTTGLMRLLQADTLHYSHAVVFKKIDEWCQRAWQDSDASMCLEYLDIMQKSIHRVLDTCDPQVAQVHEFTAQVNHAMGSAHTAQYEYFLALQIRLRGGMRYAHWTRKTWYMAAEKSLVEFLDGI